MTPLHIAVGNGDLAIAKSLLDHSADVTVSVYIPWKPGRVRRWTSPGELATKRWSRCCSSHGAKE